MVIAPTDPQQSSHSFRCLLIHIHLSSSHFYLDLLPSSSQPTNQLPLPVNKSFFVMCLSRGTENIAGVCTPSALLKISTSLICSCSFTSNCLVCCMYQVKLGEFLVAKCLVCANFKLGYSHLNNASTTSKETDNRSYQMIQ